LVIFRDPHRTVQSMQKLVSEYHPASRGQVSDEQVYCNWYRSYRAISSVSTADNSMFLHYDQVVSGDRVQQIEAFVDTPLDTSELDTSIRRSSKTPPQNGPWAQRCSQLYQELCARAEYSA